MLSLASKATAPDVLGGCAQVTLPNYTHPRLALRPCLLLYARSQQGTGVGRLTPVDGWHSFRCGCWRSHENDSTHLMGLFGTCMCKDSLGVLLQTHCTLLGLAGNARSEHLCAAGGEGRPDCCRCVHHSADHLR